MGNVRIGPLRRRHVVGHRRIFRRHAEGVPAHRHQHVVAVHAQVAVHHIIDRIVAHVAHVQFARRVRQHRASVVLAFGETRVVFDGFISVNRLPVGLGGFFNVGGTIFILHDGVRPKVNMNRTLYWFTPLNERAHSAQPHIVTNMGLFYFCLRNNLLAGKRWPHDSDPCPTPASPRCLANFGPQATLCTNNLRRLISCSSAQASREHATTA